MKEQCRATKPDGSRCTLPANGQHGLCWAHAPENAARRRRTASRGGKSKANREVVLIKEEIKATIDATRTGELDRNRARAMFTGWGVLLDYIKLERGIFVEEDLAARIEELQRGERPHAS